MKVNELLKVVIKKSKKDPKLEKQLEQARLKALREALGGA
jgi:phage-related protein